MIIDGCIYTANKGDCEAMVISRDAETGNWGHRLLTELHNPKVEKEFEMVKKIINLVKISIVEKKKHYSKIW